MIVHPETSNIIFHNKSSGKPQQICKKTHAAITPRTYHLDNFGHNLTISTISWDIITTEWCVCYNLFQQQISALYLHNIVPLHYLSVGLSLCLSVCLSVILSVRLSVCLSVSEICLSVFCTSYKLLMQCIMYLYPYDLLLNYIITLSYIIK